MPEKTTKKEQTSTKPPLGELTLPFVDEYGVERQIPALDKRWAPRLIFARYGSLMSSGGRMKTGAELDEWLYEADCFREDMEYLLSRQHHEFWSYMVHQKAALGAVVSFLQRATPFYLELCIQSPKPPALLLYEYILVLVLRIICRLITNRESAEAWLSREHMRELIYKHYLISVPMLFDLVIAVGDADPQNVAVLEKIFNALLQIEPNYKQDLQAALAFFSAAFRSIQTQTENEGFEGAGGGVLDEGVETPYDDVALYTLDCAYSLSVLLEVCPAIRTICGDIKLGQSIAHFYDTTIPFLYKNIFLVNEASASLGWLNQARLQFLKSFRYIAYSYIEAVLANPDKSLLPTEEFVGLLTECLSEQIFVIDYERQYSVELDMDILKQACKDLDDFKASFVVKGYQKEAEAATAGMIGHIALTMQNSTQNQPTEIPTKSDINGKPVAEVVQPPAGRDIDLEVTAVLEMLPDLGTGFVRRVLSRYDRSEDAIAAILEENLPPDLVAADRMEAYIPPDLQDKLYQQTGVKHYNVYDGDAYDVLTQDNPQCIIKQGKGFPNTAKNATELLDDKKDLQSIRHRYQEYTMVTEGDGDLDEYEDEYDDSYEALLESETRAVRSKQLKAGLANVIDVSDGESEDGADSEQEDSTKNQHESAPPGGGRNRMDFCENPENVRARYEAKRQAKWGNKASTGAFNAAAKQRDVVGAPKGQGQDKETLRNRNKKEANKSSRANHNRKAGAAFKRSKGMMA